MKTLVVLLIALLAASWVTVFVMDHHNKVRTSHRITHLRTDRNYWEDCYRLAKHHCN